MVGIVGYGAYVPINRIKTEEIARVWGEDANKIKKGLGIIEKATANVDEDAVTIGVEASKIALKRANINSKDIGAIFIGSESHPYVVKSSASIIGEALNVQPQFSAADLEFACRAGTTAIIINMGLVDSGKIKYGLAIGADTAQGKPGNALEYSAGSGGGAYIIGKENVVVEILDYYSYTTDTPDFWRREGAPYPSHAGRFTGEPAYFKHVGNATKGLLEKGYSLSEFDYVIFHQPNAKFPKLMAKRLGIDMKKIETGLLTPYIGNTYSGAVMLGLANVLDQAKAGDRILLTSFGSGAGSDSFALEVKDGIEEVRKRGKELKEFINRKKYIDYAEYVKIRGMLVGYGSTH